jgi:hypothetical protein
MKVTLVLPLVKNIAAFPQKGNPPFDLKRPDAAI